MPITVIDTIEAKSSGYPVVVDTSVQGGYQVVSTLAQMYAIPISNQKVGMMIYVTGNTTFYQCNSIGNTAGNFTVVSFGGFTAGSDLSGSSTNQTVIGIRGVPVNNAATSTNAGYALVTNSSGQYVQNGVAPVFNVKNFGAVGDGTADDTTAIQAAINAAISNHGHVYFPTGIYACNALNVNYATGLYVSGERSQYNSGLSTGSIIKWTGGGTGTLLTLLDCQDTHFEYLHFYGQNNQVDFDNFGVNVSSDNNPASYFVSFDRCIFSEFGTCVTWGVNPFQCDKGGIFNSEFWYYTRYGLYVGSANALDAGEIKGCTFTGAPGTTFLPLVATGGTAPPAVTLTGTPSAGTVRIDMNITTPGARGTALFTWKLNGVTQQTGQTTASTFALGSTGLALNFPSANYFSDDVYEAFATNAVGIYLFWSGLMRISDCLGGGITNTLFKSIPRSPTMSLLQIAKAKAARDHGSFISAEEATARDIH